FPNVRSTLRFRSPAIGNNGRWPAVWIWRGPLQGRPDRQEVPMQVPLQIAFHKAEKSDWAEQEIRARVDKLQTYHDRIIGCRVTVDQRARNVEGTLPPVV